MQGLQKTSNFLDHRLVETLDVELNSLETVYMDIVKLYGIDTEYKKKLNSYEVTLCRYPSYCKCTSGTCDCILDWENNHVAIYKDPFRVIDETPLTKRFDAAINFIYAVATILTIDGYEVLINIYPEAGKEDYFTFEEFMKILRFANRKGYWPFAKNARKILDGCIISDDDMLDDMLAGAAPF